MALSDYFPQMQGWKPVSLSAPSNAPQIPNDQTVRSAYLRTTLPLPLQYSGDTVKQYNSPGLSTFRIAPLPPNGIAASVAAAASTATTIINNETTGGGSGGISSVTLNVPAVLFTPSTQTSSDLTIDLIPQLAGTFFAAPAIGSSDVIDGSVAGGGKDTDPYVFSITPSQVAEFAMLLVSSQGGGPSIPDPGAGWTNMGGGTGIFTTIWTKFLSFCCDVDCSAIVRARPYLRASESIWTKEGVAKF